MTDRTGAQRLLRLRREQERDARRRVDHELLDQAELHGATLTTAGLARLQELVGRTLHRLGTRGTSGERADGLVVCTVARTPGRHTTVTSPEGTLTLHDLTVTVTATAGAEPVAIGAGRDH